MSKNIKGIVMCILIAVPAWLLGNIKPVIGAPVFAILFGMIIGMFFKDKGDFSAGIAFTSKKVLQYAVILLGFGLNLKTVLSVGAISLPIILSTILTSLIVAYFMSKLFKIDTKIATLIGVGSSICGGSAIAATAPVIDADDSEIAQAISVIFLFNLIAAIIFPTIGMMLGFSNDGFALFAGTAVNDTSSVTATASAWDSIHNTGSLVLDKATIVKLTRTLAIIPITLTLAVYRAKKNANTNASIDVKKIFPMFILYFVICSFVTTLAEVLIGNNVINQDMAVYVHEFFHIAKKLSKFFIVMAMSAIGLNTDIVKLIKSGAKPVLLGCCCWGAIIIMSISVQKIIGIF